MAWIPKKDRPEIRFPKTVQETLPVTGIHENGIAEHGGRYSVCFSFEDINYDPLSKEDKEGVLLRYEEMLKGLDPSPGTSAKVVIMSVPIPETEEREEERHDGFDALRHELFSINSKRALKGGGGYRKKRYVILTSRKKDLSEANAWALRQESILKTNMRALGSAVRRLTGADRVHLMHSALCPGSVLCVPPDLSLIKRRGHDIRDMIAPDGMEFFPDRFISGGMHGRVLALMEYPAYIKDDLISDLLSLKCGMSLSLDIVSKTKEECVRLVEKKRLEIETDISKSTRKSTMFGNWNASVPPGLKKKREDCAEVFRCISEADERLMLISLTVALFAETQEELDRATESVISLASSRSCRMGVLRYCQEQGLMTALPVGVRMTDTLKTVTSAAAACLIPFSSREITDAGGIVYGINDISGNPVRLDRKLLQNPNAFILGIPGSGKSMLAKTEMVSVFLGTDDDLIVIDPEREYAPVVSMLKGQTVHLSAGSPHHINAMDLSSDYTGGDDPVALKKEFLISLCEMLAGSITVRQKGYIDRVLTRLLPGKGKYPATLKSMHAALKALGEEEAASAADSLDLYVNGSLNIFAQETNVDTSSRLICYDIKDLGSQLRPAAMFIVLDSVFSRIAGNRKKNKRTWVWIDEMWSLFRFPLASEYLDQFWRRVRKYGGIMTGITQNTAELLRSPQASDMLSNSEVVFMMNQSRGDSSLLRPIFDISDAEMGYITNADAGKGLLRASGCIVPFDSSMDRGTSLYRAMTTKMSEGAV